MNLRKGPMRGRDSMRTRIEGCCRRVVRLLCDKLRTGPLHILSYMRGGSPTLKVPLLPANFEKPAVVITSFHICCDNAPYTYYESAAHKIKFPYDCDTIVIGYCCRAPGFTTEKFSEETMP